MRPRVYRRSDMAFGLIALGLAALALAGGHAALSRGASQARLAETAALVRAAGLTDLALFTEARYTRNPAMADLHTAFQDNPMAFEHFPSGTFAPRPASFGAGALGFDPAEVAR